jgi:hypothetical protein
MSIQLSRWINVKRTIERAAQIQLRASKSQWKSNAMADLAQAGAIAAKKGENRNNIQ